MEKITIKELAPYLPYGLKYATLSDDDDNYYINPKHNTIGVGGNQSNVTNICLVEYSKPLYKIVLRPLSDLTKEIQHNGEKFVPSNEFENLYLNYVKWGDNHIGTGIIGKNGDMIDLCFINNGIVGECPLAIYELLIEYHFDVFGLLDKNLAVPVTENFNPYK